MKKRIDLIVDLVDSGKVTCDIGTDHGITAIKICQTKSPKKMIATDISQESLNKLRQKQEAKKYNIETLVTDGIKDLAIYEPEIIIISGMGGFLISKIISDGIELARKADKLILQANNSLAHLRSFLLDQTFDIIDEKICLEEGIYYDIIVATYDPSHKRTYDRGYYYEYGYHLIKNREGLLKEKLLRNKKGLQAIKEQIKEIATESSRKRMEEIDKEIREIEEVLTCL
ncbi:MAG: class I SAM-dependent methyltransferase [Tissierellia bacterium]|nr:class I SAM-dependent methyltransferase [Tissierellia bacterium]